MYLTFQGIFSKFWPTLEITTANLNFIASKNHNSKTGLTPIEKHVFNLILHLLFFKICDNFLVLNNEATTVANLRT